MDRDSKSIRQAFFEFFKSKQHTIVESAPMVVKNDPTLMFTNAGMNQFKDIFLGNQPARTNRVADTQKCLRVSGKHNDLEEVGHDTYHHTMFEMLGNWSFGDYFKEEAISWAWEFLHDRMGIDADRLYATVFEGSSEDQLAEDTEARSLWARFLPDDRILPGNKKDNFWEMGETGPCGSCSEVHVDLRDEKERRNLPGRELVNKDHPQVIEIWNLVFMQYNRKAGGQLEKLPARHVDTGMGFERLCMVLQGKKSNYDTDIFQNIIRQLGKLCGKNYGTDKKVDIAMRVIADHLRAIAFAVADGQLPSNNKAGYVIRRILRRAVRYGYTFLGFRDPFMWLLVDVLRETMGEAFPELTAQQELIKRVMKEEESGFLKTLETGIRLLDEKIEQARKTGLTAITGKDAFELYDTFGFPLDLTELILRENELGVNRAGFDREMMKQKERSRNDAAQEATDWVELLQIEQEEFMGYSSLQTEVRIAKYRKVNQKKNVFFHVVFDKTPFYGESGGQVGDTGYLTGNGKKWNVINTLKENNLIVHVMKEIPEDPSVLLSAVVDKHRRLLIANNHTATHLLDQALREVLGKHVEQKGSLVNDKHLRFDFSHFSKVSEAELERIQARVNELIRLDYAREEKTEVPVQTAKEMGAIALFGEKYGDTVRVIRFGDSIELCGGTHTESTGRLGLFVITSESAVSAGVRRIEAITADRAEELVNNSLKELQALKGLLHQPTALPAAVENLLQENTRLQRKIEGYQKQQAAAVKEKLKTTIRNKDGVNVIAGKVTLDSPQAVKDLAFQLKGEVDHLFLVLGADLEGKASLTVMIAEDLVNARGLHAGHIIRDAAREMDGGGGGQPFFATAGGKNVHGIEAAIARACSFLD